MIILWLATGAEILGYLIAVWLLRDVLAPMRRAMALPHLVLITCLGLALWFSLSAGRDAGALAPWPVWALSLVGMAALLASMTDLRAYWGTRK